uniref:Uncharacterized protein n=1 Tax=Mus musculus TaxID=10090 RepID=S0BDP2_MOUSE|nr:hypothetical protein [Mus musculus]
MEGTFASDGRTTGRTLGERWGPSPPRPSLWYCQSSGPGAGPQSSLIPHTSWVWQSQPATVKCPLSVQCAQGVSGTGATTGPPLFFQVWP